MTSHEAAAIKPPLNALYDCTRCGACCFGRRDYVQVFADDALRLGPTRLAELVAPPVGETAASGGRAVEPQRFMRMTQGHCSALRTNLLCAVYEDRPVVCRVFEAGSAACIEARSRAALFDSGAVAAPMG